MPDNSEHLDPREATEAKLCAYLEGELSPTERIEIEQHLKANPQHRQLLADLAKTRDWMRSVPRETSPVDLGEIFKAQVERSMLLDDSADASAGMSINRWPQYALVAAITVLALGLGVVLIAILKTPQQNGTGGTYAIQNKSIPPVTATTGAITSGATTASTTDDLAKRMDQPVAPLSIPAPAPGAVPGAVANTDRTNPTARLMGGRARGAVSEADTLKTKLAAAGIRLPIDQKTVCFVVSADSPPAAIEQVRGFFDRHQIAADLKPGDKLETQLQNNGNGNYTGNGGGNGGGGGIAFGNANNREAKAALPGDQNVGGQNISGQNINGGTLTQNRQQVGQQVTQQPNQQPNQQLRQNPQNDLTPNIPAADANAGKRSVAGAVAPQAATETYYVAHGVTPLQLELLNDSLVSNDLKQTVARVTLVEFPNTPINTAVDAATNAATKEPAATPGAIARGQTLTITIPQLVGPGIEKVNVVKVGEDGNITLPMIDPLPAAGASAGELQQRIADKYRETNLIDAATVTVVIANPPATQAANRAVTDHPATELKDAELKAAGPTTRQSLASAATTHPAADLVDVVVVIRASGFQAPAARVTK